MFTALRNHDKVGLLFFTDDVVKYIPPRKGRANVLRLIRELLATEPVKAQTDISKALDFLGRVQRRRCVVFVMSDFLGPDCSRALAIANQRHDCVAVTMGDPRESSLPDVGFLTLRDAETDELLELDTRHPPRAGAVRESGAGAGTTAGGLAPPGERRPPRDSHRSAVCDQPAEVLPHAGAATMIARRAQRSCVRSVQARRCRGASARCCVPRAAWRARSLAGCGVMRDKTTAHATPHPEKRDRADAPRRGR